MVDPRRMRTIARQTATVLLTSFLLLSCGTDDAAGSWVDVEPTCVNTIAGEFCSDERMVVVPPGVLDRNPQDLPLTFAPDPRLVETTYAFMVDRYETTVGEWEALLGPDPMLTATDETCIGTSTIDAQDSPLVPVRCISLWDAMAYANARSESEGYERCYEIERCTNDDSHVRNLCLFEVYSERACLGYRVPWSWEWELGVLGGDGAALACIEDGCLDHLQFRSADGPPVRVVDFGPSDHRGVFGGVTNVGEFVAETTALNESEFSDRGGTAINPWLRETHFFWRAKGTPQRTSPYGVSSRLESRKLERPWTPRADVGVRLVRTLPQVVEQ